MKKNFLELLRCPKTKSFLKFDSETYLGDEIINGYLINEDGSCKYPIIDKIPRFVPDSNYANNFGFQWNKFRQTQLDSYSETSISGDRFWSSTLWSKNELAGKWVLDCGCGSGRFAEIALNAGAYVVALDYSNAVDACYLNLKGHPNLYLMQGDIYELPFKPNSFDFVYSLGVLQHTPNVKLAFMQVANQVKIGGKFCVDFYEKNFKSMLLPKFWLRPITKRMNQEKLFSLLEKYILTLFSVSELFGKLPLIGKYLKRLIPVANYSGILPLDKKQLLEWALLDTFDWLGPEYDNPQRIKTLSAWMNEAKMKDFDVLKVVHIVARGIKRD
jgi:SAM-dependent methyltransferase